MYSLENSVRVIRSMGMKWVGHMYFMFVRNAEVKCLLGSLGVGRRIILKRA